MGFWDTINQIGNGPVPHLTTSTPKVPFLPTPTGAPIPSPYMAPTLTGQPIAPKVNTSNFWDTVNKIGKGPVPKLTQPTSTTTPKTNQFVSDFLGALPEQTIRGVGLGALLDIPKAYKDMKASGGKVGLSDIASGVGQTGQGLAHLVTDVITKPTVGAVELATGQQNLAPKLPILGTVTSPQQDVEEMVASGIPRWQAIAQVGANQSISGGAFIGAGEGGVKLAEKVKSTYQTTNPQSGFAKVPGLEGKTPQEINDAVKADAEKRHPSVSLKNDIKTGKPIRLTPTEQAMVGTGKRAVPFRVSRISESPATLPELPQEQPRGLKLQTREMSSSNQDTTNKVEYQVTGDTPKERIASVRANSESAFSQLIQKGQTADLAGQKITLADRLLAEKIVNARNFSDPSSSNFSATIKELSPQSSNPKAFTDYVNKRLDYYDYQLAAERASGGTTERLSNYMGKQRWDIKTPEQLTQFNKLALQKGIQPWDGISTQPRVFNSYAEGEAAGFKRANADPLIDLRKDYTNASEVIRKQVLKQGLKQAVPKMVSQNGYGKTTTGKPFINSNVPGLEGLSYDPFVHRQLKGYQPFNNPDFIKLIQRDGAEAVIQKTGIGGAIEKMTVELKSVPKNAQEAGFSGVVGSLYDHVNGPMKQILWNWSGFHSLNITLNQMGASILHPITGTKGLVQSVGSLFNEKLYQASENNYRNITVTDTAGKSMSVFDWAIDSGAFKARDLPATGAAKLNPFTFGKQGIFGREIPILQLNIAEQAAKKGIIANSPMGREIGNEIQIITGEINTRTMNINPNTLKAGSRLFLAPGFTFTRFKVGYDAFTKWGKTKGAAGNLARTDALGKSAMIGIVSTLGTLLATGKFPNLKQILMNFTFDPSMQTNITNTKGQKKDVVLPRAFLGEAAGLFTDPVTYLENRLAPLISDGIKVYTNQDSLGRPIVDPNVPESKTQQIMTNLGIGHLPIGAQSVVNQLRGKQNTTESAIQIAGARTRINKNDPTIVKYKQIDDAKSAIANVNPDDPQRTQKIQDIYNNLTVDQRKSLNYQLLLAGTSTKGVLSSNAGKLKPLYDKLQIMKANGQTAEANAEWNKLSPTDKTLYAKVKTYYKRTATSQAEKDFQPTFQSIRDMKTSGDPALEAQADSQYNDLTPTEKKLYQNLKKTNL